MKPILVVEDDEGLLETLRELLNMEGYDVALARNGVEALEILKDVAPAVVVLDMRMPQMDGETFAREVHRRVGLRSLYIIVLTANLYTRKKAEEIGANDFLAKPFDIDELLEKIELAIK